MAARRNEDIMNASEVALFLGLGRNSVYDAVGRGEIPHRRVGRRLIFSRSALVAWLDRSTIGLPGTPGMRCLAPSCEVAGQEPK